MATGMRQLCLATIAAALSIVGCRDDSAPDPRGRTAGQGLGAAARPRVAPQGVATRPLGETERNPPPAASSAPDDVDEPVTDEDADCAPAAPKLKPVQLLRFRFTSGVEQRDPVDQLHVARPGQRVWAHLRVRNRSGRARCLKLLWRIDGKKRTELSLEVGESWNWRTWAYATLRDSDRSGAIELEAVDDQGNVVAQKRLPIVPEPPPR